jgi:hypothetical protein
MRDSGTWPPRRWRPSVTVQERASGLALSPFFGTRRDGRLPAHRWCPAGAAAGEREGLAAAAAPIAETSTTRGEGGSAGGFRCILRGTQDSRAAAFCYKCTHG